MIIDFLGKHRKYVWSAVAVAVYAALGFFLAPWLLQKNLVESVRKGYGAELRLEKVEVNPFVLSLRLTGFELDDPDGAPIARVESIFVNFQLSSLFRWAWTFNEFRVTAPELFVARDETGNLNLAYLFGETAEPAPDRTDEPASAIMRMLVFDFAIENCAINWHDEVPVDTIETRFGPINVEIKELNTLPNRSGQQSVLITTESTGTLSWTGSLQLNPLKSAAHASIKGAHFPLTSAYIHHQTATEEGKAPVSHLDELAYSNEIRRQLIAAQPLAETALANLATERAENARIAILEIDENFQDRVRIAEIKSVTKKSDEMIEMKVTLSATK